MTIIYSNRQDEDCSLLPLIWKDMTIDTFIELDLNSVDWEYIVDNALSNETETLILVGHGTSQGLLSPTFNEYVVHENNVKLIKAKHVICLWCHASSFTKKHGLKSFSSSMFITNIEEAYDNGLYRQSQDEINEANIRFYNEINAYLRNTVPLCEWVDKLSDIIDSNNDVDTFNCLGLEYDE